MKLKKIKILKNRKIINVKPGSFKSKPVKIDKKGFFLIKTNNKTKNIYVGFVNNKFELTHEFISKSPVDLRRCIVRACMITEPSHTAYLGAEIEKAYYCIKHKKKYVQS